VARPCSGSSCCIRSALGFHALSPESASRGWGCSTPGPTTSVSFLFGGKAYAIFAMMFGVSFFLILDRWSRREIDFQGRFLWRLVRARNLRLRATASFYTGDILLVIAVLGVPLVFFYKLGNRALAWIPWHWCCRFRRCGKRVACSSSRAISRRNPALGDLRSFFSLQCLLQRIVPRRDPDNLWEGQLARIWWTIESGGTRR